MRNNSFVLPTTFYFLGKKSRELQDLSRGMLKKHVASKFNNSHKIKPATLFLYYNIRWRTFAAAIKVLLS